jgi:hypothetical protein
MIDEKGKRIDRETAFYLNINVRLESGKPGMLTGLPKMRRCKSYVKHAHSLYLARITLML